jgi:PAS domain S-box-containing protein
MQKRILLVEDEPVIAMRTRKILEESGFQVITAVGPREAFEAVHGQAADCILMDIDLGPDSIDGAETARIIMDDYDIPIIFLTNYTDPLVVEKTKSIASYGYVIKNSGPAVLIATIYSAFRLHEKQKKAEGKLQQLIENQNDIIYCVDSATGEFSYVSPAFHRLLGYTVQDIRRMGGRRAFLRQIIQNNDFDTQEELFARIKAEIHTHVQQHISVWRCKDGSEKYIEDSWVPSYQQGKLENCYGVLRDITDRMKTREDLKRALKEKEHLVEEINHRVKNNLTLINSLIYFKSIENSGVCDLSDLQQQISAIGRVYNKLFQKNGIADIKFKSYVKELLESVFFSMANYPVVIENNVPDISLTARITVPLGLIINEIAINAIKHGFLPGEKAVFTITLKTDTNADQYILILSNNGRAFPGTIDIQKAETLGLRLISDLLEQLKGTMELRGSPYPVFTFRFPRSIVDSGNQPA